MKKDEYDAQIFEARIDHRKFQDREKNLRREEVIKKLRMILISFTMFKKLDQRTLQFHIIHV